MTSGDRPPRGDLERDAAGLAQAIQAATHLLRTFGPVMEQLQTLQDALVGVQSAVPMRPIRADTPNRPPPSADAPTPPVPPEPTPLAPFRAAATSPATPSAPTPSAEPEPEGAITAPDAAPPPAPREDQHSSDTHVEVEPEGTIDAPDTPDSQPSRTDDGDAGPPVSLVSPTIRMRTPAPRPGVKRTISVTVSRADGPLDLVRVHSALEAIPGVTGLALTSYTRGRAGILLETDHNPTDLPVRDALAAAFPEGVAGSWQGDGEYVAVIGAQG